jgi:hypothetical protein
MKHFLIRYHFTGDSEAEWQAAIARFIADLEGDAELGGKIAYRAMRSADGDYFHLASPVDEAAVKALGERPFFERYTALTERAGGGEVSVVPLDVVAETQLRQ